MKTKGIRIYSGAIFIASFACVILIMFGFFRMHYYSAYADYYMTIWGFQFFSDPECWENILVGTFGLASLLWDFVFASFAVIDGRYKKGLWRVIRYGYSFGAFSGLLCFGLMVSNITGYEISNTEPCAIAFAICVGIVAIAKIVLMFFDLKQEDENTNPIVSTEQK